MTWRNQVPTRGYFVNKGVSSDGYSFSSKLEAATYQLLKQRLLAGEIKTIQVQDHILICGPPGHRCPTHGKIESIVDFKCTRQDGSVFWVEAKGFESQRWPMKKRLWRHFGPGVLELWGGSHARPKLLETITPMGV